MSIIQTASMTFKVFEYFVLKIIPPNNDVAFIVWPLGNE